MRRSMQPPCLLQLQSRLSHPWLPSWANKEMAKVCVIVLSGGSFICTALCRYCHTIVCKVLTDINLHMCTLGFAYTHTFTSPHTPPIHSLSLLLHLPSHSLTHPFTRSATHSPTHPSTHPLSCPLIHSLTGLILIL